MAITRAEAFAPATVANLGVGFDLMGMAVEGVGDTISAEWCDSSGAVMLHIEGDHGQLPREPDKNVATVAANKLLKDLGIKQGVGLRLRKGLPAGSGLGSSAASAVAAAVAVNGLLGEPLALEDLLPACLAGEFCASGGYHADNIAPCLLGGITLTHGPDISRIKRLPVPDDFYVALVTPAVVVPTAAARQVLPEHITLKQMIHQTGAVADLVDALHRGDVVAMAQAMESDQVVEPARAHLMPLLEEIRFAAKRAGALGLVISGAGSTLCAICNNKKSAEATAQVMQTVYTDAGIHSVTRFGTVLKDGARLL